MTKLKPLAGRLLISAAMLGCAGVLGWHMYDYYMRAPWTRDGHVRADVVGVAPDVAGLITQVLVHDNEDVQTGQALFRIDPQRYQLALTQAEADVTSARAALDYATSNADRYDNLAGKDVASEQAAQEARATKLQAAATLQHDLAARDLAQLNLERSTVRATVSGRLTNFTLQPGDYASAGTMVASLIDTASIHVSGYFEETKLDRITLGAPARITLMAGGKVLQGHVEGIAGGIADQQRNESTGALPNVTATFTWVRLAQRVPVDIRIDGETRDLVVGSTATVEILTPNKTHSVSSK